MRQLFLCLVPPATILAFACAAAAQDAPDRVTFGDDVYVGANERVHDVITMGGDATVDGEVTGSVVAMGGDVVLRGTVDGDVVTMGGDLSMSDAAVVRGDISTAGGDVERAAASPGAAPHHAARGANVRIRAPSPAQAAGLAVFGVVADAAGSLVRHLLLFLLALLLAGLVPERFTAVQAVIAREPVRVGVLGLGVGLGAALLIAVLAITVVGIPASVLLAMGLALASYVGLASIAGVVGAALPVPAVHGKPVRELAAGTAALWVASLVPFAGTLAVFVAGLVGLGAVVHTRFGKTTPPPGASLGAGPFRTPATV